MTQAGLSPTCSVLAYDEHGAEREVQIAGERPLTIYLDRREIVTLMTLGRHPEALVLGYLKNQNLIRNIENVTAIQVDWETSAAAVTTTSPIADLDQKLAKKTVTTGCGQGTMFGEIMESLDDVKLQPPRLKQSVIYDLLYNMREYNDVYKSAGAVHGCALCEQDKILTFIEDVGRHNAVDAIAGIMWLEYLTGDQKIFYTTGRLTSEMVIKVSQMGISILLSRSGVTQMGLELAQKTGVTMIARAKGKHFLVFTGKELIDFDAKDYISPSRRSKIK
ncbi:MAG: formate dehydrogenase accessory sulfurtransferase FdhD [Gammaproteobacteria bacterium]